MKKINVNFVVIAEVLSFFLTNFAFAWDDKFTHPALTGIAVENLRLSGWLVPYFQNNLGFKEHVQEKLPYNNKRMSILDILKDGSKEEDA